MNPAFEAYAKANGRSPEGQLVHDIEEFEHPMAGFRAREDKKLDEFAALKGWQTDSDGIYKVTHEAFDEFNAWLLSGHED